jgi:hypothetical protein
MKKSQAKEDQIKSRNSKGKSHDKDLIDKGSGSFGKSS